MMRTWQTRLSLGGDDVATLDAYAPLYGRAERSLFAELAAGQKSKNDLKRECLQRFCITARQFNAIRIGLEGKVRSIQERRPDLIKELAQRITKAKTTISRLRSILTGSTAQRANRSKDPSEAAPVGNSGAEESRHARRSKEWHGAPVLRLTQAFSSPVRLGGQWLRQS